MNVAGNKLNDSLDDLFADRAIDAQPKAQTTPPASYQAPDYTEPCKKCGGSGRFQRGRFVGQCYTCKGKGKQSFKTSPQTRQAAVAKRAQDKERAFFAWTQEFKAEYEWIQRSAFGDRPFGFAVDLNKALHQYGSLTDGQLAAVRKCIIKEEARNAERQAATVARIEAAPAVTVDKVEAAFDKAREKGLQKLKLRLGDFVFSAKNPTTIYVKVAPGRFQDTYLGKIVGGKFLASRDCSPEQVTAIQEAAADPEAAAIAYGKRFGTCSCCGATLTNPASIALGIGPICASKWFS